MTPAIKFLDQHNVDYQVRQYDSGDELKNFGEHAASALEQDPNRVFKTLISVVDGNQRKPVVALVAVSAQLDLKSLAAETGGRKAVLADEKLAQRCTGYLIGGISPLAQKQRHTTFVDRSAQTFESIFISGGKRGLQLELAPDTLIKLLDARYCDIAK